MLGTVAGIYIHKWVLLFYFSGEETEIREMSHALAGGFFNQVTEKAHPGAPLRPLQKPLRLLSQGATSDTG